MKKKFSVVVAIIMMVTAFFGFGTDTAEAATEPISVNISVQYYQTDARSMLNLINNFRTGNENWYWDTDNSAKIYPQKTTLVYDYNLEKIAMQRAAEIALQFSHDRPDGSAWSTMIYGGTSSWAENIAAGQTSVQQVFNSWKEADENYAGQGHRRNMLDDQFTAVGIAHVYYNGVHYWVQEFGYSASGAAATTANNSNTSVPVEIDQGNIVSMNVASSKPSLSVDIGKSVAVPSAQLTLRLNSTWPARTFTAYTTPSWIVGNSAVATISGNTVTGQKKGSTTLTATVNGKTIRTNLTVTRPLNISRYGGADRYETAILSADAFKRTKGIDKFSNIIVASGANYPDALSGSYLAKVKDAPILLVSKATENKINQYINTNLASGGTVYILGGTKVVSNNFKNMVAKNHRVVRLAGDDRYGTNIEILKAAGVTNEELLVCSGNSYADSLSVSSVGKPILLVGRNLNHAQRTYLNGLQTKKIYLVGGTNAVSRTVENSLKNYTLQRFAGADRFDTSAQVARTFFGTSCTSAMFVYGHNFPDGLSGAPLAMATGSPVLLATNNDSSNSRIKAYVQTTNVSNAIVMGGQGLISNSSINKIVK